MELETLKQSSKSLRTNQTPQELLLWKELRASRFKGYKFRRQFVIKPYIVDFICLRKRLIIELDGGHHMDNIDYDSKRDTFLRNNDFTVIRFWNNEVDTNLHGVLENIENKLIEL